MAVLQRELTCPADARGTVRIQLSASAGTNEVALDTVEAKIEPRHKWPQRKKLTEKVSRSQFCKALPRKGAAAKLTGYGSDQRLVYAVTVRAKARGTGDLAALRWRGETTVACEACPRQSGSIAIKDGRAHARRISKKTRVSASADRAWYDCARKRSTLAMRFFANTANEKAIDAIRPVFVLDGLEKHFSSRGRKAELELPVPVAKLCRALGTGTHELVWEVFGDGELMRIGPGRSRVEIACP
jgi:hypothetical protein